MLGPVPYQLPPPFFFSNQLWVELNYSSTPELTDLQLGTPIPTRVPRLPEPKEAEHWYLFHGPLLYSVKICHSPWMMRYSHTSLKLMGSGSPQNHSKPQLSAGSQGSTGNHTSRHRCLRDLTVDWIGGDPLARRIPNLAHDLTGHDRDAQET